MNELIEKTKQAIAKLELRERAGAVTYYEAATLGPIKKLLENDLELFEKMSSSPKFMQKMQKMLKKTSKKAGDTALINAIVNGL